MASQNKLEAESTESYEDAVGMIADQLEDPNTADQLIEFTVTGFRFRRGGFAGFPATYIVEASAQGGESGGGDGVNG